MKEWIRSTKNGRNLYVVLAFLMFIFVFMSFQSAEADVYDIATNDNYGYIEPNVKQEEDNQRLHYEILLGDVDLANNCIAFYTNHQEVKAYCDGMLVYSLERADSRFGHTTGSVWNLVKVPEGATKLSVDIRSVYPEMTFVKAEFIRGNEYQLVMHFIKNSVVDLFACALTGIIGAILIGYWVVAHTKTQKLNEMFYLGIFALILGIWAFGETEGAMFIIHNRVAASYGAFVALSLVYVPFILFVKYYLDVQDKIIYKILLGYALVAGLLIQILQTGNIMDVKRTGILSHIGIGLTVAYLCYAIIRSYRREAVRRRLWINIIGMICLVVPIIIDMVTYYMDRIDSNNSSKFGFLLYVVILGVETAMDTQQRLTQQQKLEFYRELAVKDVLTGCFNRNAYSEDCKTWETAKRVQIITFDVNDLKRCNDELGHAMGDKLLEAAAEVIRSVYGKYGKVYRTGGDEFTVLTKGLSDEALEELHERFVRVQKRFNQYSEELNLEIACGYTSYDPENDITLQDTQERADKLMYEDKKELKGAKK